LSKEEFSCFTDLNGSLRSKFTPLSCGRGHQTPDNSSFAERVNHSKEDEFVMALDQVCRIFRFRIEDRVAP
jgi:2-oxo-4-hydroxy-4-carboxy-5-ureidoimidazoline decarboxylase